jgi:hypothetical protein
MMPALVAAWFKVVVQPRPVWAHYYDPEVSYFYSGFSLLELQRPANVEHPGTPLQILSAMIVWCIGRDPLSVDQYRASAYVMGLLANTLATLLLLRTLLSGLNWQLQVAAIWTYWFAPQSLEYLNVVSPEMWYLPAGALIIAAAWWALEGPPSPKSSAVLGIAIGLGVALKFTHLAWIPAGLVVMPIARAAPLCIAGFVAGVVSGFVLGTAPIATYYPYMFSWITSVATHSGDYGAGHASLPRLSVLGESLATAIRSAKAWHLWTLLAIVVALAGMRDSHALPRTKRLFVLGLCTAAGTYAMALRHFHLRYILVAGVVSVLLVGLALARHELQKGAWPNWILATATVLVAKSALVDARAHTARIRQAEELRGQIEAILAPHVAQAPTSLVVYSYRAPEPSYPMLLGAPNRALADVVHRHFPNRGAYNPWTKQLVTPGGQPWDMLVIRQDYIANFPQPTGTLLGTARDYLVFARLPADSTVPGTRGR